VRVQRAVLVGEARELAPRHGPKIRMELLPQAQPAGAFVPTGHDSGPTRSLIARLLARLKFHDPSHSIPLGDAMRPRGLPTRSRRMAPIF
jgi:hypothetical protein